MTILAAACGEDPVSKPPVVPASRYDLVWRDSVHNAVTRPVVDDSMAYFFDYLHNVTAVDKRTGKLRWRTTFSYDFDPGFRLGFGMAIAGGNLVVGDLDVFGLDRHSGAIKWRFSPAILPREQAGRSHLTTDGSTVYTGSVTGRVYALDAASGSERWRTQVADSTFAINDPVLVDGVIYVALSMGGPPYGGGVAAVRAADGKRLWLTQFPTDPQRLTGVETGVGVSDELVFAGAENDRVVALDRGTGAVRQVIPGFTFRPPGTPAPLSDTRFVIAGSRQIVVVGSLYGIVVGLDGSDGHVRWSTHADGSAIDMRIADDRVYLAGGIALDVLRLDNGLITWSVPVGDFPYGIAFDSFASAPAVDADRVYLGGDRGLYAFKKR